MVVVGWGGGVSGSSIEGRVQCGIYHSGMSQDGFLIE